MTNRESTRDISIRIDERTKNLANSMKEIKKSIDSQKLVCGETVKNIYSKIERVNQKADENTSKLSGKLSGKDKATILASLIIAVAGFVTAWLK